MSNGTSDQVPGGEELATKLAVSLLDELGRVEVVDLRRLTGGASRETWSFDAISTHGTRHELVLRRDPPGRPAPPGTMPLEAAAMSLAGEGGVAVPEVLAVSDSSDPWGSAGVVMRRLRGEALGRRILRSDDLAGARGLLVAQIGEAMARLHSIDAQRLANAPRPEPLESLRDLIDLFAEPVATFECALRWLAEQRGATTDGAPAIVHGDFRLGNLLVDRRGLTAVLDWELVHVGDPVEDLGWCCVRAWRFGADDRGRAPGDDHAVAGLGSRRELLDAYEAAGGRSVTLDELHWWEVYGTLRWGVICLTQAAAHLRGDLRSVELAAIGRRVAETEWDLLRLLEPAAAEAALGRWQTPARQSSPEKPSVHGHPDAGELLDSVREFLSDRVVPSTDGTVSYEARVAANVLAIVGRELERGSDPLERRALALRALGVADEAELCTAIRSGRLDLRRDEMVATVADGVVERLAVANPAHFDI